MSWIPTVITGAVTLITAYQNEIGQAISWFWKKITGQQLRQLLIKSRANGHHSEDDETIEECVRCWDAGEPHFLAQEYEPTPTLGIENQGTAKDIVLEKQGDGHSYKLRTMQDYVWQLSVNAAVPDHTHVWSRKFDLVVETGFEFKPPPGVFGIIEPWQWPVPNAAADAVFGNRWDIDEHVTYNWAGRPLSFTLKENDSTRNAFTLDRTGRMTIPKGTIICTIHWLECYPLTGNRINEIILRTQGVWELDGGLPIPEPPLSIQRRREEVFLDKLISKYTRTEQWDKLKDLEKRGLIKKVPFEVERMDP